MPSTQADQAPQRQDRFLNEIELAVLLGISQRTVQRWRLTGGGPPYRKFGGSVRYGERDALEWAAAQVRRSTSDPGPDSDRRAFVAAPQRRRRPRRRKAGEQPEAA